MAAIRSDQLKPLTPPTSSGGVSGWTPVSLPTERLDRRFTYAWAAWVAVFFAFEGWAIFNKTPGDTLSEHTRHYFQVKGKVGTFVFLGMFGTFAAWFSAHIIERKV